MKNVISLITVILLIIVLILFSNIGAKSCIKKGGKVVTDVYGLFDKCIYE